MFSQRKSFLKGKLFYIVLLGLFAFGLWINQAPVEKTIPEDISAESNYPAGTNKTANQSDTGNHDNIMDNIIGAENNTTSSGAVHPADTMNNEEPSNSSYYLVKEVDGVIKVFFYDNEGKESLIRDTDIAFSLLSVSDQKLFQKGIIKQTAEELDELLQDFES